MEKNISAVSGDEGAASFYGETVVQAAVGEGWLRSCEREVPVVLRPVVEALVALAAVVVRGGLDGPVATRLCGDAAVLCGFLHAAKGVPETWAVAGLEALELGSGTWGGFCDDVRRVFLVACLAYHGADDLSQCANVVRVEPGERKATNGFVDVVQVGVSSGSCSGKPASPAGVSVPYGVYASLLTSVRLGSDGKWRVDLYRAGGRLWCGPGGVSCPLDALPGDVGFEDEPGGFFSPARFSRLAHLVCVYPYLAAVSGMCYLRVLPLWACAGAIAAFSSGPPPVERLVELFPCAVDWCGVQAEVVVREGTCHVKTGGCLPAAVGPGVIVGLASLEEGLRELAALTRVESAPRARALSDASASACATSDQSIMAVLRPQPVDSGLTALPVWQAVSDPVVTAWTARMASCDPLGPEGVAALSGKRTPVKFPQVWEGTGVVLQPCQWASEVQDQLGVRASKVSFPGWRVEVCQMDSDMVVGLPVVEDGWVRYDVYGDGDLQLNGVVRLSATGSSFWAKGAVVLYATRGVRRAVKIVRSWQDGGIPPRLGSDYVALYTGFMVPVLKPGVMVMSPPAVVVASRVHEAGEGLRAYAGSRKLNQGMTDVRVVTVEGELEGACYVKVSGVLSYLKIGGAVFPATQGSCSFVATGDLLSFTVATSTVSTLSVDLVWVDSRQHCAAEKPPGLYAASRAAAQLRPVARASSVLDSVPGAGRAVSAFGMPLEPLATPAAAARRALMPPPGEPAAPVARTASRASYVRTRDMPPRASGWVPESTQVRVDDNGRRVFRPSTSF